VVTPFVLSTGLFYLVRPSSPPYPMVHRYPDQHSCSFDYKDKNYRPINLVKVAGDKGLTRI